MNNELKHIVFLGRSDDLAAKVEAALKGDGFTISQSSTAGEFVRLYRNLYPQLIFIEATDRYQRETAQDILEYLSSQPEMRFSQVLLFIDESEDVQSLLNIEFPNRTRILRRNSSSYQIQQRCKYYLRNLWRPQLHPQLATTKFHVKADIEKCTELGVQVKTPVKIAPGSTVDIRCEQLCRNLPDNVLFRASGGFQPIGEESTYSGELAIIGMKKWQ